MLVCVSPETIVFAARRAWPMLNSILFGPIQQLITKRDIYVSAMRDAGYTEDAVKTALASWSVSRHMYVAPTDREAIEEAKAAELWYQQHSKRFRGKNLSRKPLFLVHLSG
jgi:alkanesulfonate monooxygenase SsuD/methylene tetrahydromethanopterin reductase-like flavin-dependent oxidoreductase (luciferase family)